MLQTVPTVENQILKEDMAAIYNKLSAPELNKLRNSTILLTGCGGFLGYYFMHFFAHYAGELKIKKIIALENFLTGTKDWLTRIVDQQPDLIKLHEFNVITDSVGDVEGADKADIIIHMASIASPTFYRIYPIETVYANITGLRRLLDYYSDKSIRGFLFFSSSEIYGDPFPEFIPTKEDYRGNVATIGPRACYDEAKRFGETLCYLLSQLLAECCFPRSFILCSMQVRPHNLALVCPWRLILHLHWVYCRSWEAACP